MYLYRAGNDGGSTDRQKGSPPGGGNHRLLLLNNPHKEPVVVKSLTQVVPACDEQHARNCFNTSQTLGMAIVTSCLKEHAEHYMMQLHRYGVTTAIEPDTTTA
jgi:ATP-dependent Clp protease adapter protein ClpS